MGFSKLDLSLLAAVILASAPTSVLCDTRNWNPTGQGCVDPKGFLSCYDTRSSNAVSCVSFCDSDTVKGTGAYEDCILGCGGAQLAGNVGCWIQSCWNQVRWPLHPDFLYCLVRTRRIARLSWHVQGLLLRISTHSPELLRRY